MGTDVASDEVTNLIVESEGIVKELYRIDKPKDVLLDIAKRYEEDGNMHETVDYMYGEGAADYIAIAIKTYPEEKKEILKTDFDIPMSASMSEEANIICNLGEGIRERSAMETAAGIIANIMKNNKVSFEEAFASIFMPDKDKESIRDYVNKQLAVK